MAQIDDVVLAGCLTPLAQEIRKKIDAEFFDSEAEKEVFKITMAYLIDHGEPMSKVGLLAYLDTLLAEQKVRLFETVNKLSVGVDSSLVRVQAEALIDRYKKKETLEIAEISKQLRIGNEDEVREQMTTRLLHMKHRTNKKVFRISNKDEKGYENFMQMIEEEANRPPGLYTGVREIDEETGGAQPGELWVYYAASGDGKSTMLRNHAYHAAIVQKKRVILYTAELSAEMTIKGILFQHAFKKFGYEDLNFKLLKQRKMTAEQKKRYDEVAHDFYKNPEYGHLMIEKTDGMTIQDIHASAEEINRFHKLDGIYIDYLDSLPTTSKQNAAYLAKAEAFVYTQQNIATNFNGGQGIPVITAHQINKIGKERARRHGGIYYKEDAADTPGAYRSPDVIISLFQCANLEGEKGEVEANLLPASINHQTKMSFLKNRTGATYPMIPSFIVEGHMAVGSIRSFEEGMVEAVSTTPDFGAVDLTVDFGGKEEF